MTEFPPHYRSCTHPEDFLCDFLGFYREADRRTALLIADGVRHVWHSPYGDHPSQVADLFFPRERPGPAPVFVFLHGGGFTEGHPDHYGFLAEPFLEHGALFVSAGYRLAPEATMADSIADGAVLLAWLHGRADQLGIDRSRIYVGGHSAGAMIWASLVTRQDWQAELGLPVGIIAGAVLVSGVYDFQQRQRLRSLPPLDADDPLLGLEPLGAMNSACRPLVIAAGSPELNRVGWPEDLFESSARALHAAAVEHCVTAEILLLPGFDHRDTAGALGDVDGTVFAAARTLIGERSEPSGR